MLMGVQDYVFEEPLQQPFREQNVHLVTQLRYIPSFVDFAIASVTDRCIDTGWCRKNRSRKPAAFDTDVQWLQYLPDESPNLDQMVSMVFDPAAPLNEKI